MSIRRLIPVALVAAVIPLGAYHFSSIYSFYSNFYSALFSVLLHDYFDFPPPSRPKTYGPIEADSPLGQVVKEAAKAERAGDNQRAVDLYSSVLAGDEQPSDITRELLRRRAFAYEGLRQYERAEANFTAALQIEPVDPEFYAKRGFFLTRRARYDDALADFQNGAELDPQNATYAYGEGGVYERRGEHKRAIERFSEAIRLAPNATNYYVARGGAYNNARMAQEAFADYDKALQIGYEIPIPRETARARQGRGYALLQLKEYQRAIEDFDAVLAITPGVGVVRSWRGYAYERLGNKAEAVADYKAALAINPDLRRAAEALKLLEAPQ
jgi:tetratricopeptide (TPR) repeat protein